MRVLTSGHVNVTPLTVPTSITLETLREGLGSDPYSGHPPDHGWGGIDLSEPGADGSGAAEDDEDQVPEIDIETQLRSEPGSPRVANVAGTRLLLGRYLTDRVNSRARRRGGNLTEAEEALFLYDLEAIDVVAMRAPQGDATDILVGTHSVRDVRDVSAAIRRALPEAQRTDPSPDTRFRPEADLYLWLLGKTDAGALSDDLHLTSIRTLQCRDPYDRKTRYFDWADLDRPELLMQVRDPAAAFGPAKLVMVDDSLGLELDWFLREDGSFSLFVGSSAYGGGPSLSTRQGRIRLVRDVSTTVIPKLYEAHANDDAWHDHGRDDLRARAESTLHRRLGIT